jgi:hypothetical protein
MIDLHLYDGWNDDDQHPPICAGCGRPVCPDVIDDDILCRSCSDQLKRLDVCWPQDAEGWQ